MSNTLIATLGGICGLVFWGMGDWLIARTSRRAKALDANLAFQLPSLLIIAVVALASGQHVHNWHNVLVLSFAGFIFALAFVSFIKAYAAGSTGLVTPAACTYPLFTLMLTAIFLSLTFTHHQILAMLVVSAGVMLLAYEKRKKGVSLHVQHRATLLALLTAFLWGIGNVIQNSVISKESWQIVLLSIDIATTFMAFLMVLFFSSGTLAQKASRIRASKTAMVAGAVYVIGSFGFYYSSVRVGSVLIPLVVSSASPLITSTLGAIYEKERLGVLKRAGAVIVVAGIVLLNVA